MSKRFLDSGCMTLSYEEERHESRAVNYRNRTIGGLSVPKPGKSEDASCNNSLSKTKRGSV